MATLVSPGVSVSVVDETMTVGAGQGTVPLIILATGQNKTLPDGSGIANGTLLENAGKLYPVTSQRELLQLYGDPVFRSVSGVQMHGDPTNEYGLLAAYSYLGIANMIYTIRGDVDLNGIQPSVVEPKAPAEVGTVWLDSNETKFGVFVYVVDTWVSRDVLYIFEDGADNTIGNNGEFAMMYSVATPNPMTLMVKMANSWVALNTVNRDIQVGPKWPMTNSAGVALVGGDIWIKTSTAANGANFVIRIKSASTNQFVLVNSPMFADDTGATEYYGTSLKAGDVYVNASAEALYLIKQYTGNVWENMRTFVVKNSEPTAAGPAPGTYWYDPEVGLDSDGFSSVDLMWMDDSDGTSGWDNVALPGFHYNPEDVVDSGIRPALTPGQPMLFLLSSDPIDVFASTVFMDGDIWVDTDQLVDYPVIFRRKGGRWIQVDNSDQTTPGGVIFRDARVDPTVGIDADAPDPDIYPRGFLLWNTRFSSRVVKQWIEDYTYNGVEIGDRWVNVSGNAEDGSPLMGTEAQRSVIVKSLQSAIISNEDMRAESIFYNLIACPGFPECIDEMITLNVDRKETAFIIGDTPFTLKATSIDLQNWALNSNGAAGNGQHGIVSANPYLGVYYPSGLSTNVDGNDVVVPPSHILLRTMAYSDQVAFPWFAPAGMTRGLVSNATSVGYVDSEGEFVPVELNQGLRDLLYINNINPIRFIPGSGLVVWGQKSRNPFESAMDRINVARLVNHIRYQSDLLARPFLFEPNDEQTRKTVKDAFDRFMAELVSLRGISDFLVVCDTSNNTPARIDRNELWIDILVQPVRTIEFIYIPVRIRNTGADMSI